MLHSGLNVTHDIVHGVGRNALPSTQGTNLMSMQSNQFRNQDYRKVE
jgi:hypothetical protein